MDKKELMNTAWKGFREGAWMDGINVRNFIQKNYTLYEGDDAFLAGISPKTKAVWDKCSDLIVEEIQKGIIDVETTSSPASTTSPPAISTGRTR